MRGAGGCRFRRRLQGHPMGLELRPSLDAFAILSAQPVREFAAQAALLHLQLHERNPRLQLAVNALSGQAAMVNTRAEICFSQRCIDQRRPMLAQADVLVTMIWESPAPALERRDVGSPLLPEACRGGLPRR